MPHSILQAAIFIHLCEMFVGVAPCTSLFRHFFVLVKSGKAKDHLGAYYFQTRPDSAGAYIPSLGGARWENWCADWVIVSVEANDRLTLPSDGPTLDRKQWRAKPSLAPELLPVGQDQGLGGRWYDLDARGRRFPEASGHTAAEEAVSVLLVHRPK
jgi:hypothetical protein